MCATLVVDALWGDSGKGKIAAYSALKQKAAFCVRAGTGTNAGHSIYFEDGSEIRTHQLCCGWLHPRTQLRIGSGVAVDPEIFLREIRNYKLADRTGVDLRCPVIEPEHRAREVQDRHLAATLGSVCSGSGAARADFVLRRARQARDIPELQDFLTDVPREINTACRDGGAVVIESSQGTHLSLALTTDYPFCTSDNCTTVAAADDAGLNWQFIKDVILVVKAVPSRVGAGPLPFEMSAGEQDRRGIVEYGVTTGRRVARLASFDRLRNQRLSQATCARSASEGNAARRDEPADEWWHISGTGHQNPRVIETYSYRESIFRLPGRCPLWPRNVIFCVPIHWWHDDGVLDRS